MRLKSAFVLSLTFILLFCPVLKAENINIGILSHYEISKFSFTVKEGNYAVFADNHKLADIGMNDLLFLTYVNNKIEVRTPRATLGNFSNVKLIGTASSNYFNIKPIEPSRNIRSYDDNLKISVRGNHFLLVNNINLENYIAGVVEAEVGENPAPEFFKLQAILCRTYALKQREKHQYEGFNLCDRVHCQAYHHRYTDEEINHAAHSTEGIVIVDNNINLITAAFYSNCGGQTVNSEDVWQKPLYYLRSVKDPWCRNEPNAHWKKEISAYEWNKYLRNKYNLEISQQGSYKSIPSFYQSERKTHYSCYNVDVPLKFIRQDFRLKSTFFEVREDGDKVVLTGRGFGHGSGLCQEGAMKMASSGKSYVDILHFYYKDVHLINLSQLSFFKEE